MKTLITAFIIFCSIGVKAQFHVSVQCFGHSDDAEYQDYYIRFTRDNWKTGYTLMVAFDISTETDSKDVCFNPKLFISGDDAKTEAIQFAKQFNSYSKCIMWNYNQKKLYLQLLAYRESHPIVIPIKKLTKKACCTVTKIY